MIVYLMIISKKPSFSFVGKNRGGEAVKARRDKGRVEAGGRERAKVGGGRGGKEAASEKIILTTFHCVYDVSKINCGGLDSRNKKVF